MDIAQNIKHITLQMAVAAEQSHRFLNNVMLVAVSKGHDTQDIIAAYDAGICNFGESYLQEALEKQQTLTQLPLHWHFIGPIQSNKAANIASRFSWVHSLSRLKIAQMLHDNRDASLPPLNVCLQVNLDNEPSKSGLHVNELYEAAAFILTLPRLQLRGLMSIPKPQTDLQHQYLSFLRLTHALEQLNKQLNITLDTLSMGMSDDFHAAIRAGSTIVRLGSAIFGPRYHKEYLDEY